MEKIIIRGGKKLKGEVKISTAKNAVLPIIVASILSNNLVSIKNAPLLEDVFVLCEILKSLGINVDIDYNEAVINIHNKNLKSLEPNGELVRKMRASSLLMGPLLARFGEFKITTVKLNHPGGSYAFKIESGDKSFIYSTDVEFNEKNYDQMPEIIEFFKGAEVLTFDSQYTLEESFTKIDWGHSSIQIGIDIANHSGIKKIVLFHYDPTYSDQKINEITEIGLSYKKDVYPDSDLEVIPSHEGLELEI